MSKTVKKVFLIIGILVLCLIVWTLVFNEHGIMVTAYNSMASSVNKSWRNIAGGEDDLIPTWGDTDAKRTNGNATDSTKSDGGTGK